MFWHANVDMVPCDCPLLLLGHEFLDALPVHQFVRTEHGWRERMVDLKEHVSADATRVSVDMRDAKGEAGADGDAGAEAAVRDLDEDERHLDFVLTTTPTPASSVLTRNLPPQLPQVPRLFTHFAPFTSYRLPGLASPPCRRKCARPRKFSFSS